MQLGTPLRVPSARTYSCCASRLGRFVLSARSSPRPSRLSPEEASTLRLSAVATDALLEVAQSIQLCLCDVLDQRHLVEVAYRQQIASLEAELSAASRRADALQALVVASDAASIRLERRVELLDSVLRQQLLLTDRLSGECRDLQLAQLAPPQSPIPVHCTAQPVTPPRAGASPSPRCPGTKPHCRPRRQCTYGASVRGGSSPGRKGGV